MEHSYKSKKAFIFLVATCATYLIAVFVFQSYETAILTGVPSIVPKLENKLTARNTDVLDRDTFSDDIRLKISDELIQISHDLASLQRKSRSASAFAKTTSIINKLHRILRTLHIPTKNTKNELTPSAKVCPESYKVTGGYSMIKCNNSDPLPNVVSILLNFRRVSHDKQKDILSGIEMYHENIEVIIAVTNDEEKDFYSNFKLVIQQHSFSSGANEGELWNKLVSSASTPFVLIGRDLDFFTADARIERLVRESELLDVSIIGGATRTPDGHWKMGCEQRAYKNFTVAYKSGYDISKHECVYCDYISGPFVAKTNYLRKNPLKRTLGKGVLFHDYMMQMHNKDKHVVVCPDSMYHVTMESAIELTRKTWIPFAKEWKLNRLHLASGTIHKFTEKEAQTKCTKLFGKASPPQCLQYLADSIKFVMKSCEEQNIICELRAGTVLGTLKFGSVIPWERDGDIGFFCKEGNYSSFKNMIGIMRKGGYTMKERGHKKKLPHGFGKFDIPITGWRVEAFGCYNMDTVDLLKNGFQPTKTILDGQWVNVPRNPGLYARNKFGYEMYRHQEHIDIPTYLWPKYLYHPTRFRTCPSPRSHDCLDQYITDGNIQFEEPEP